MHRESQPIGRYTYLFISHSHHDIKDVRIIRNELEECGYEPICFFLASLHEEDELDSLIKKEIDARRFFVYADSSRARESPWVRKELEHLRNTGREVDRTINLDVDLNPDSKKDYLRKEAQRLIKSLKVFLSYSHRDIEVASRIAVELERMGYDVSGDSKIPAGVEFRSYVRHRIDEAAETGCILILLSENYCTSEYLMDELRYSLHLDAIPLLVCLGEPKNLPEDVLFFSFGRHRHLVVSSQPDSSDIERITMQIDMILRKYYQNGYTQNLTDN